MHENNGQGLLKAKIKLLLKKLQAWALAGVAQLVGASSSKLKGHGFNFRSGHIPGLWSRSPVQVRLQEAPDRCFSLTLMFLSPSVFLPSSHSKIKKHALRGG